MQRSFKT